MDGAEELETGQGGSQRALSSKKPSAGTRQALMGLSTVTIFYLFPLGFVFVFEIMSLPFLVSRQQPLTSVDSDSDFVTPKPRRTNPRRPNTQQSKSKKKAKVVFSSDEASEDGMTALPRLLAWGLSRACLGRFGLPGNIFPPCSSADLAVCLQLCLFFKIRFAPSW